MEEPITIVDRDVLKALSVDTRMDIMKELSKGSRTPSDLGKMLNKSSSTIVEHLEGLVKAGLVKKIEQPGKKWIFYTLTERGEGIILSKSRKLVIILSISALSIAGSFVSLYLHLSQKVAAISAVSDQTKIQEISSAPASAPAVAQQVIAQPTYTSTPVYMYVAMILFVLGLIGVMFYLIKQHKRGITI